MIPFTPALRDQLAGNLARHTRREHALDDDDRNGCVTSSFKHVLAPGVARQIAGELFAQCGSERDHAGAV